VTFTIYNKKILTVDTD